MKEIKEQAIALIKEFEKLNSNKMSDDSYIEYPTARVCALVVVNHILKVLDSEHNIPIEYWQEVKIEIEEKL